LLDQILILYNLKLQSRDCLCTILAHLVRRIIPYYVDLTDQDCAPNHHRSCDDGYILSCKVESSDMDMFASKDVSPQETSQRCTKCRAECSVVDTQSHGIYGGPESAIADWDAVVNMDLLPSLNDSSKQNSCANVCACELWLETLVQCSCVRWNEHNLRCRELQRGNPFHLSHQ